MNEEELLAKREQKKNLIRMMMSQVIADKALDPLYSTEEFGTRVMSIRENGEAAIADVDNQTTQEELDASFILETD